MQGIYLDLEKTLQSLTQAGISESDAKKSLEIISESLSIKVFSRDLLVSVCEKITVDADCHSGFFTVLINDKKFDGVTKVELPNLNLLEHPKPLFVSMEIRPKSI